MWDTTDEAAAEAIHESARFLLEHHPAEISAPLNRLVDRIEHDLQEIKRLLSGGGATPFTVEWARGVLEESGLPDEKYIQQIVELRTAAGLTSGRAMRLGVREARDLVLELNPYFAVRHAETVARRPA